MSRVLEIENVSLGYPDKQVLKDITFGVDAGEFVSIIGPNGSGKTTLIKAISKNISPVKGVIRINGQDIRKMPSKELARTVAVVLQAFMPVAMPVKAYVQMGRLPYLKKMQFFETREDIQIAEKYMELTNTLRFQDARINEISGGEQQLASIARALTQEPCLLILDEPTSHLDITHQARILELIHTLRKTLSLTVIMVQHDLNLAAQYSDQLVLIDQKSKTIYKKGRPETVLTRNAIQDVYHTRVKIGKNPVSDKPCVFLDFQQTPATAIKENKSPC